MIEIFSFLPILIIITMAALISELSGALNIALEGIMLLGSFLAVISIQGGLGNIPGVILAAGIGLLLGLLLGGLHVQFGANIFIAGLGMNLLTISLTSILGQILFGTKGLVPLQQMPAKEIILLIQVGISLAIFLFILITFSWSLVGLRFRSIANHSQMLYARGVNTGSYKIWALGIAGALAAIAGAFTSLSIGAYVPNGTAGKGWIALVLVFAGGKHPLGILLGTIIYLIMDYLAISLQHTSANPGLLIGLPYLGLLSMLIIVQLFTRRRFEL
jgi:general nucleoside transport system permease protein